MSKREINALRSKINKPESQHNDAIVVIDASYDQLALVWFKARGFRTSVWPDNTEGEKSYVITGSERSYAKLARFQPNWLLAVNHNSLPTLCYVRKLRPSV